MPCYKPSIAYLPLEGGQISFTEKKNHRTINIACKQCVGCRIMMQNAWAVRILCEAQMHPENWFITWTYDDANVPANGSLVYSDFQSLNRRLRKELGSFRFFVAGEYGDSFGRCHWHSINFGLRLPDLEVKRYASGSVNYRSKALERIWGKGNVFIGTVTPQSARYVASYTLKKLGGKLADERYTRVDESSGELTFIAPEMARMSLKPGLGASWFAKYWPEVIAHRAVVGEGGTKYRIPRYFNERIDAWDDDALVCSIQADFAANAASYRERTADDNTPERLRDREECTNARVKFYRER